MAEKLPAITIWQPWATLIAEGAKPFEFRSWPAAPRLIGKRRDDLEMTQLQLPERIGLTRGSVANIEAGRQSVLLHQFLDIAAALNLSPHQLTPAETKTLPTGETSDMPESVLDAIQAIRTSTGSRTPPRR